MPRKWVAVALAALVAVIAVMMVLVFRGNDGDESAGDRASNADTARLQALVEAAELQDPARVELPPSSEESAEWFESDGEVAVAFVEATRPLWVDAGIDCDALGAALDELAEPEELMGISAEAPDEGSRELFIDLHAATVRALGACQQNEVEDRVLGEFAWQWALADRRLDELGVQR